MFKTDSPFLSIIIPARNEGNYIGRCLEAIKQLNFGNRLAEFIVVDNGSTDNTRQISESYGAKVFMRREGTISSLRNYGVKMSRGEVLAFLDADCVVAEDWLTRSLSYLEKQERSVLGFRLCIPQNLNWVAKCWDLLFVKRYSAGVVDWIPSGNMIMWRKTFVSVGGFNEALETNEDYDFCFRARKNGCEIISSSETSVVHLRPPQSLMGIFRKELWHGKESFKEFKRDLLDSKFGNLFRAKNGKVVGYSIFYLLCILLCLFSIFQAFVGKASPLFFVGLVCPVVVSFALAMKYVREGRKYELIFGMTVLLMVYGLSRALGLVSFNNWASSLAF